MNAVVTDSIQMKALLKRTLQPANREYMTFGGFPNGQPKELNRTLAEEHVQIVYQVAGGMKLLITLGEFHCNDPQMGGARSVLKGVPRN